MSSWLQYRARLLVHKRARKFGLDSSDANPPYRQITLPDARLSRGFTLRPVVRTRWRLQVIEIPAHPLDYGPRRPPSVVGAVRASVQRSRELLRETGVAWSACEVRSVSHTHPRSPLFTRRRCRRPRRAPLGNDGTRDSPSSTRIIGFAGRPDATWFSVGVMHFSWRVSRN